jgi:hypothetical protein
VEPADGGIVTAGSDKVAGEFGDGRKGIVIDLAAGYIRDIFIQQFDHLAGHARFGLPAQTQEQNIMARQQRALGIRDHGILIPENARKGRFLIS